MAKLQVLCSEFHLSYWGGWEIMVTSATATFQPPSYHRTIYLSSSFLPDSLTSRTAVLSFHMAPLSFPSPHPTPPEKKKKVQVIFFGNIESPVNSKCLLHFKHLLFLKCFTSIRPNKAVCLQIQKDGTAAAYIYYVFRRLSPYRFKTFYKQDLWLCMNWSLFKKFQKTRRIHI